MKLFSIITIGALLALACSYNSITYLGIPIIYFCLIISFTIHWILFVPAYILKTEKFYDITGTLSYLSILGFILYLKTNILNLILDERDLILSILILIWTVRLGGFLLYRILKTGEDKRFGKLKNNFYTFLLAWSLSALWVFITSLAAITAMLSNNEYIINFYLSFGTFIWVIGFLIELIADTQKMSFNLNFNNKGKFINVGLWRISRHPNYFGEILLWVGIAIISFPLLSGWQYISLISPIFVYLLLTRVSGINLLEEKADRIWGDNKDYHLYKNNTPKLFPFIKSN